MAEHLKPEHPYKAIVKSFTVYAGDDLNLAMSTFERFADGAAIDAGADMVFYVRAGHMVPGNESRPVVEAMVATASGPQFIGALYGVTNEQWRSRPGI